MVKKSLIVSVLLMLTSQFSFAQGGSESTYSKYYVGVNVADFVLYNYNAQFMYRFNPEFAGVFYMAGGLKDGMDLNTSVQDIRFELGPRWMIPEAEGIFLQISGLLVDSQIWYVGNEWSLVQGPDGLMYYEQVETTYRERYMQTGFSLIFGAHYEIGTNAFVEVSGSYGLRWSNLDEEHPHYESFDNMTYSGYEGPSIRGQLLLGIKL
ncbi:MAG: hypothetical protein HWD92_11325 [Flavobacteriia bacterium]|nr:hypothetical protein [Flavobacteriia bacterium]